MENVLEEGKDLSVNELIVSALDVLDPRTTVKELADLIRNDDIDLARMIYSLNTPEENIENAEE